MKGPKNLKHTWFKTPRRSLPFLFLAILLWANALNNFFRYTDLYKLVFPTWWQKLLTTDNPQLFPDRWAVQVVEGRRAWETAPAERANGEGDLEDKIQ